MDEVAAGVARSRCAPSATEFSQVLRVAERAERPGDGVAYSGIYAWEFRDGRCSRFESYYDDTYAEFWSARSN
jgi:hypothetical protein